jgi:hypothetical protein
MLILVLAEKYGQSPEQVENWDQYWLNRAALRLEVDAELDRRREKRDKTRRK